MAEVAIASGDEMMDQPANDLGNDVECTQDPMTLEEAVGVVKDGVELLDCVDQIYFEVDTGIMRIETETGTLNVLVSVEPQVVTPSPEETIDQTAERLRDEYGHWGEHPKAPVADWRYAVEQNETRVGYWDWAAATVSAQEAYDSAIAA
jgi:hypothetical protein